MGDSEVGTFLDALFEAVQVGRKKKAAALLHEKKPLLRLASKAWLLSYCRFDYYAWFVGMLLDCGIDVNLADENGMTGLIVLRGEGRQGQGREAPARERRGPAAHRPPGSGAARSLGVGTSEATASARSQRSHAGLLLRARGCREAAPEAMGGSSHRCQVLRRLDGPLVRWL